MFPDASQQGKVTKLKKSLYRLRDAARVGNGLLFRIITDLGLEELKTAPFVFVKEALVIICYVDDLIQFTRKESEIDDVKRRLNNKFKRKDPGKPKRFLGMDFKWA